MSSIKIIQEDSFESINNKCKEQKLTRKEIVKKHGDLVRITQLEGNGKYSYDFGQKYPGLIVGHGKCQENDCLVPKYMGWLWNVESLGMKKVRKGWCPGAIPEPVKEIMQSFLATNQFQDEESQEKDVKKEQTKEQKKNFNEVGIQCDEVDVKKLSMENDQEIERKSEINGKTQIDIKNEAKSEVLSRREVNKRTNETKAKKISNEGSNEDYERKVSKKIIEYDETVQKSEVLSLSPREIELEEGKKDSIFNELSKEIERLNSVIQDSQSESIEASLIESSNENFNVSKKSPQNSNKSSRNSTENPQKSNPQKSPIKVRQSSKKSLQAPQNSKVKPNLHSKTAENSQSQALKKRITTVSVSSQRKTIPIAQKPTVADRKTIAGVSNGSKMIKYDEKSQKDHQKSSFIPQNSEKNPQNSQNGFKNSTKVPQNSSKTRQNPQKILQKSQNIPQKPLKKLPKATLPIVKK